MERQPTSISTSSARESSTSTAKLPAGSAGHLASTVMENCGRLSNQDGGKVRFPPSQSPLVTLLQKKREGVLPSGAVYIDPTDCDKLLSEAMDYLEKKTIKADSTSSSIKRNSRQIPPGSKIRSDSVPVTVDSVPVSTRKLTFETSLHTNTDLTRNVNELHPRKIEDFGPGHSSLALIQPFVNDCRNPPVVKSNQFSRHTESDKEVEYRIRKKTQSMSPSQSYNSVHDLHNRVQKRVQGYPKGFSAPPTSVQHHQWLSHTSLEGGLVSFTREQQDQQIAQRKHELSRILSEERRKKLEEERRNVQLRRHSDFFMPSQKSPVPLNRYDESVDERELAVLPSRKNISKVRGRAKALYNFTAQNDRELSFRKGDILYLSRRIDRNWFEGEYHGLVGRFPVSYVEVIVSLDSANALAAEGEGVARTLYNFSAQSSVELSLRKGDLVKLIRRMDENWFEGHIGSRRGIFPVRYVETLIEPNTPYSAPMSSRTVTPMIGSPMTLSPSSSIFSIGPAPTIPSAPISPVDSELMYDKKWNSELWCASQNPWTANSQPALAASRHLQERESRVIAPLRGLYYSSGGLDEPHSSVPAQPDRPLSRSNSMGQSGENQLNVMATDSRTTARDVMKRNSFADSVKSLSSAYRFENGDDRTTPQAAVTKQSLQERKTASKLLHMHYPLYRAQYRYIPRNSDELTLNVGDVVCVVEKCDDGWFVGFSERSKDFGTFPGNYVQQLW